jgi:hypothetical protein
VVLLDDLGGFSSPSELDAVHGAKLRMAQTWGRVGSVGHAATNLQSAASQHLPASPPGQESNEADNAGRGDTATQLGVETHSSYRR